MIEYAEALALASQVRQSLSGCEVKRVYPPTSEHRFTWFSAPPAAYGDMLAGRTVTGAEGFGIHCEIAFGDVFLAVNDGVNLRLVSQLPKKYQLALEFSDGKYLVFTVAMYGGIICHGGGYDNPYYLKSRSAVPLTSDRFDLAFFRGVVGGIGKNLSVKAAIATEQRFPGLGNGMLQDILLAARINPRTKLSDLSENDIDGLFYAIKSTATDMADLGGRSTEKGIFGISGGYSVKLYSGAAVCPVCGDDIVKENYLGGAVYYCPTCQPKVRA